MPDIPDVPGVVKGDSPEAKVIAITLQIEAKTAAIREAVTGEAEPPRAKRLFAQANMEGGIELWRDLRAAVETVGK